MFRIFAQAYKYFNNKQDLDDFSLYAASQLFNRYYNEKLPKIKSCMNYVKKVINPYKSQYQTKFYRENITREKLKNYDVRYDSDLELELINKSSGLNQCDFVVYLDDIAKTIKESIKCIPHKLHSNEFENIYISCLLTFLDLITLSDLEQEQLNQINRSDCVRSNLYQSLYKMPKNYKPILYHLSEEYNQYILYLTNKAKISIKNDLKEIIYSQVSVQNLYNDLLNDYKDDDDF